MDEEDVVKRVFVVIFIFIIQAFEESPARPPRGAPPFHNAAIFFCVISSLIFSPSEIFPYNYKNKLLLY